MSADISHYVCTSVTRCDQFLRHFAGKVSRIRADLESKLTEPIDMHSAAACPVTDYFQLMQPVDVNRLLGSQPLVHLTLAPVSATYGIQRCGGDAHGGLLMLP